MDAEELSSTSFCLEVKGLNKSFDGYFALKDLNFKVMHGESVTVFGPNGAGKTTLIKILATIMNPTSGTIIIDGVNIREKPEEVRRNIGLVSHNTFLYNNLTAYENLDFYRRLYDVSKSRIEEVAETVGMSSRLNSQISTLSRGMQQRFSIARALLHNPAIILLDEPETGLDQQALASLWTVIRGSQNQKRTVITASHNLERGLEVSDRLIILSRGSLVYENRCKGLGCADLKKVYNELTEATL
jgi:heme exporter protein A